MRSRIIQDAKSNLDQLMRALPEGGDRRLIAEVAGTAKTVIVQRTSRGLDENERPFTPYPTKPYRAPIEKRPPGYPKPTGGRPGRDPARNRGASRKKSRTRFYPGGYGDYKSAIGRGSDPQLSISGKMLGAIVFAITGVTRAELFFSGREEAAKAHGHQFGTTTTKRPFFGISGFASQAELEKSATAYLREATRRAGLLAG